MDFGPTADVTASRRIDELISHAERLKARRHQGEVGDADKVIEDLQKENKELREKLGKALLLLSLYKGRCEQKLNEIKHIEDNSPTTISKRSLLSRYLDLSQQRNDESPNQKPSIPKERVTNMWRDRLLKRNSQSPQKKTIEEPNNDVLDLARQLNSRDVKVSKKQPPVEVEEISLLLSRRL
jgi:hypothetical protein